MIDRYRLPALLISLCSSLSIIGSSIQSCLPSGLPPDGRTAPVFEGNDIEAELKSAPANTEAVDLYCMTFGFRNWKLLSKFKNLKRLEIGGPDDCFTAADIKALSALPIESFYIRADHTGIGVPAAISQLKHVKYLSFMGGWEPVSIADFARNRNLEGLNIGGKMVGRLDALRPCTNLKTLTFAPRSEQDIRDLYQLPQLDQVCISGCDLPPSSLRYLSRLRGLKNLDVSSTKFGDDELAALAGNNELERLNLSKTPVTDSALTHVSTMKNLRALSLQDCAITDKGLANLAGATALEELDLLGTKTNAVGLSALKDCGQLRNLRLGAIQNTNLRALSRLPSIEYLNLQAATLNETGARYVASMPRLRTLIIGKVSSPEVYSILKGSPSLKNLQAAYIPEQELAAAMTPMNVLDLRKAEPDAFKLLIHNTHDIRDWSCF